MAEHRCLSEPAVAHAPPLCTCQADRADVHPQGIWVGESGPGTKTARSATRSVHGHMGPSLRCANGGTCRGGKAAELRYQAGSGHPYPHSFPKHRPKNRHNQVSKKKRNEKVECHNLRCALRLLFSRRGSPLLGLLLAFPDQKQLGRTPWARPSAVASGRGGGGFFLFIPPCLPSCRL